MSRYNRFYNRRKRFRRRIIGEEEDYDDTTRLSRLDEYGYEIPRFSDQPIDNERQFYSQYHIGRPSTGDHINPHDIDWWNVAEYGVRRPVVRDGALVRRDGHIVYRNQWVYNPNTFDERRANVRTSSSSTTEDGDGDRRQRQQPIIEEPDNVDGVDPHANEQGGERPVNVDYGVVNDPVVVTVGERPINDSDTVDENVDGRLIGVGHTIENSGRGSRRTTSSSDTIVEEEVRQNIPQGQNEIIDVDVPGGQHNPITVDSSTSTSDERVIENERLDSEDVLVPVGMVDGVMRFQYFHPNSPEERRTLLERAEFAAQMYDNMDDIVAHMSDDRNPFDINRAVDPTAVAPDVNGRGVQDRSVYNRIHDRNYLPSRERLERLMHANLSPANRQMVERYLLRYGAIPNIDEVRRRRVEQQRQRQTEREAERARQQENERLVQEVEQRERRNLQDVVVTENPRTHEVEIDRAPGIAQREMEEVDRDGFVFVEGGEPNAGVDYDQPIGVPHEEYVGRGLPTNITRRRGIVLPHGRFALTAGGNQVNTAMSRTARVPRRGMRPIGVGTRRWLVRDLVNRRSNGEEHRWRRRGLGERMTVSPTLQHFDDDRSMQTLDLSEYMDEANTSEYGTNRTLRGSETHSESSDNSLPVQFSSVSSTTPSTEELRTSSTSDSHDADRYVGGGPLPRLFNRIQENQQRDAAGEQLSETATVVDGQEYSSATFVENGEMSDDETVVDREAYESRTQTMVDDATTVVEQQNVDQPIDNTIVSGTVETEVVDNDTTMIDRSGVDSQVRNASVVQESEYTTVVAMSGNSRRSSRNSSRTQTDSDAGGVAPAELFDGNVMDEDSRTQTDSRTRTDSRTQSDSRTQTESRTEDADIDGQDLHPEENTALQNVDVSGLPPPTAPLPENVDEMTHSQAVMHLPPPTAGQIEIVYDPNRRSISDSSTEEMVNTQPVRLTREERIRAILEEAGDLFTRPEPPIRRRFQSTIEDEFHPATKRRIDIESQRPPPGRRNIDINQERLRHANNMMRFNEGGGFGAIEYSAGTSSASEEISFGTGTSSASEEISFGTSSSTVVTDEIGLINVDAPSSESSREIGPNMPVNLDGAVPDSSNSETISMEPWNLDSDRRNFRTIDGRRRLVHTVEESRMHRGETERRRRRFYRVGGVEHSYHSASSNSSG